MLTVFQICFFVGIGLIILSILLGNLLDSFGMDGLDLDFEALGFEVFIPFSPLLYILFAVVFGGVGWILMISFSGMPAILIILISILSGIGVSALVNFLVIIPLKKAQNTSSPSSEELIGLRATVIETILEGGYGKIRYVANGNSFTAPAKTTNGSEIKAGREVAICWIKDHVFYVIAMDDMQIG